MKCKVCGKKFKPKKENKYLAQEAIGVTTMFRHIKTYECFDCPVCGCQNFVNIRMDAVEELRADDEAD